MIYKETQSNTKPAAVRLEPLPDGSANVWMARNIKEVQVDAENGTETQYLADVGFFNAENNVTEAEIAADPDGWWAYAEAWERGTEQPTIEERVADMEAAVLALLGG